MNTLFPLYEVPLKHGSVGNRHSINWRWNLVVADGTRSLFGDAARWEFRRKVNHALEYAHWVRAASLAYPVDPDAIPLELRKIFVGSQEPPFEHGDEL